MMLQLLGFKGWGYRFSLLCVALAALAPLSGKAADRLAGRIKNETSVYSQPDGSSQVVGKLKQGMTLWLAGPAKGDFYPMTLPKPVNNVSTGWIRAADVQAYSPSGGPAGKLLSRRANANAPADNMILVSGGMNMVSPHEWQAAMGETQGSGSMMMFSAEIRRRMGSSFSMGISGFYGKLSGQAPTIGGTYSVTGMGAGLPLVFALTHSPQFTLNIALVPGLGLFSAGNTNSTQQISTTNIMAFMLGAKLEAGYWFSPSIGTVFQAGYMTSSLSSVATLDASGNQVAADAKLSSLGFGLGIAFAF